MSGIVEHINSGDEEWARGVGVGTGHRSKKICLLWKWGTILLMFERGGGGGGVGGGGGGGGGGVGSGWMLVLTKFAIFFLPL